MAASVSSRHKRRRIQKKLVTDSAFYEENAEKHSIATESVTAASVLRFYHQVFKQPTSEHHREQTLKVTDGVTAETIANATTTLKDDIVAQGGNTRTFDSLLQQLHTLHGKGKEFLFGSISVLQKESNKNLEKDLQELQDRVRRQENQIIFLENRVKEYKKLQVKSIETEDSNDSRLDEDELGEITKLVGDINELTLPTYSGDKSLHYELEIEQTNDFEQTIENLKTQIEHLNKTIIYLEQENQQLKKKVDMGVTHDDEDTSEKTFANTCKKNPKDDNIPATEQDDEDAKKVNRYFTQPIVKALGELFSREDKKATRIFKEKSTDWLRGAEHVARNNEWDDNQKIRFFSDRLKGEAFEWHENYVEEEGDDLNYQDWKEALISRFQDTYDLASLEKKLSKLTQKPEENCRAFVSRLNNLCDTIAGKEERADHNQTIIEG
ncbi:hypothetical protein OUZ56_030079 [Daphnia magna]|uniref:Ty3 transposon capsid-like protein domain-containing protein n=1 Tax=Daphnia magna TaxID=35525 RepID=A0ABQ9ZQ89_9CRUS|nr:hypothetical protein OUZ56_030079 [Daphnia magna]